MTGFTRPSSFILGVCGGSGSGKTTFAQDLKKYFGHSVCEIVLQDSFYFDQSEKFDGDGGSVNFDHPDSIDFSRLASCLADLKHGNSTEIPIYDFRTHSRAAKTQMVEAKPIIIVDGILIFHSKEARALFDDLVFFDTPEELRFERRLDRDVRERGRTPEGVRAQFFKQVKPMHDLYVEPSKAFARRTVYEVAEYADLLAETCANLQARISV